LSSIGNFHQRRLAGRLLRHHLPIGAASIAIAVALLVTRPYKDVVMKLSFSTAYPALALISLTLLIGPWNHLLGKRMPVSSDWRRDVGIWAGVFAIAHTAIGQFVHLRGRPWLYYVYEHWKKHVVPVRHDLFGFSNYTGLAAVLVVVVLLATSNDASLRKLGTRRWKKWQRWNYVAFVLVGAHAIGYLTIEKQKVLFVSIVVACLLAVVVMQGMGYWRRRRQN
jgi:methionine sulfoxide reductase heme-binding subunit